MLERQSKECKKFSFWLFSFNFASPYQSRKICFLFPEQKITRLWEIFVASLRSLNFSLTSFIRIDKNLWSSFKLVNFFLNSRQKIEVSCSEISKQEVRKNEMILLVITLSYSTNSWPCFVEISKWKLFVNSTCMTFGEWKKIIIARHSNFIFYCFTLKS